MPGTDLDPPPRERISRPSHEPTDLDGPDADPESVARAICLRLLTTRARTRAELARELHRRRVPDAAADAVLRRLAEVGLVDDAAFAAAWVGSRHATRGLSRRALARELSARGVDRALASAATDALDPDTEFATARDLVRRRLRTMGAASRDVQLRRLTGLLARKGYPPALAARAVGDVLRESAAQGSGPEFDAEVETAELDGEEQPNAAFLDPPPSWS